MKTRGFSIVEVMVSASLFLATATAVLSANHTAMATYEHQRRLSEAISLAEYHLEELLLRYAAHDDVREGSSHSRCVGDLNDDATCRYTLTWTVSTAPGVSGLRQILLRIGWNDTDQRPHTVDLVTYRP